MSDIDKLCATFTDLEIEYTRRKSGGYEYVFVGECRSIYHSGCSFESSDLDSLLRGHNYFEFENSRLASYSNA